MKHGLEREPDFFIFFESSVFETQIAKWPSGAKAAQRTAKLCLGQLEPQKFRVDQFSGVETRSKLVGTISWVSIPFNVSLHRPVLSTRQGLQSFLLLPEGPNWLRLQNGGSLSISIIQMILFHLVLTGNIGGSVFEETHPEFEYFQKSLSDLKWTEQFGTWGPDLTTQIFAVPSSEAVTIWRKIVSCYIWGSCIIWLWSKKCWYPHESQSMAIKWWRTIWYEQVRMAANLFAVGRKGCRINSFFVVLPEQNHQLSMCVSPEKAWFW